jgi:hypothetical protein
MAIKTFPYTVLKQDNQFEIRAMDAYYVVKSKNVERLGYQGFDACFRYISGDNQASKSYSMTAPVINRLDDTVMVDTAFVLLGSDTPPQPNHQAVIERIESTCMVVYKFKGNINDNAIKNSLEVLETYINAQRLTIKDGPWLARYNPPFIPGFLKRNEMMMEVTCV